MARHPLKILQHLRQDVLSVSDHFGTLCMKGLMVMVTLRNHDIMIFGGMNSKLL